jgi:hypothetical protein
MPEGDGAQACGLRHTAQVRDRDAGHAVDRVDAVELERIDDQVKAIRELLLCFGCICIYAGGFAFLFYCCISYGMLPIVLLLIQIIR